MPTANKTMVDAGLKKIGFGGLSDPALFDQIAFVVSGKGPREGHARFLSLLMSAEPEQRKVAYDAIAPKLRFKALPLDDYIRMGRQEADKRQLPIYNKETLVVEDWRRQEITTQDYVKNFLNDVEDGCICSHPRFPRKDCPTHGESAEFAEKLYERARADKDSLETKMAITGLVEASKEKPELTPLEQTLRDSENNAVVAKESLLLVCERCTREQVYREWNRPECLKTASSDGWTLKQWTPGTKTILAEITLCPACTRKRNQ